jgi:predicted acetyltransferase
MSALLPAKLNSQFHDTSARGSRKFAPRSNTIRIEVIPAAREQEPILANLLELYIHDFSELLSIDLGPDGRFVYPQLDLYWTEPDRHPFLVTLDGKWAGFVLVKRAGDVWDMAEFFVVRAYRRRGIGSQIAREIWQRFPGSWEVRVMEDNLALAFWRRTVPECQPAHVEKNGRVWRVFSFDVKP